MTRIRWYGPTLVLVLTILAAMVAGPSLVRAIAYTHTQARIELVRDELEKNPSLAELSDAFRKVAQAVEPSVVHIQVYVAAGAGRPTPESMLEQQLRRFFRQQEMDEPSEELEAEPQPAPHDDASRYDRPLPTGTGSGWVYALNGQRVIVTNHHVVRDADRIRIRFRDGTERDAEVVGQDEKTDIAVLKVPDDGLHPAALAQEPVQQGDIVFAFGSPLGFEFSMSQGIVSAKGRRLGILGAVGGFENFIQTDAAINRGNSGGPLTNIYGQVVGMNTAIATRTGAHNGLGFAIPINMIKDVVDQIITHGKVSRGFLGIMIRDLDPRAARTFGYDGKGVLVEDAIPDSPAAEAGLLRGDIVTKVNGQSVETADDLRNLIAGVIPGTEVKLELFRANPQGAGEKKTIRVTVAELPTEVSMTRGSRRVDTPDAQADLILRKLGLSNITTLTQELATRYRLPNTPGVLVRSVRPNSVAHTEGLRAGMVITNVMGVDVATRSDLINELNKHADAEVVRLTITDGRQTRFVFLEVPQD